MENRTKIIIVRHGQSIGNATKTILGHTDLDLSELDINRLK
jgi:broad specificity phosphatase PhoE